MPIPIFNEDGPLRFSPTSSCELPRLATQAEYDFAPKEPNSIFVDLSPGCRVELQEGFFLLDDELDLISIRELE